MAKILTKNEVQRHRRKFTLSTSHFAGRGRAMCNSHQALREQSARRLELLRKAGKALVDAQVHCSGTHVDEDIDFLIGPIADELEAADADTG